MALTARGPNGKVEDLTRPDLILDTWAVDQGA
jgi:hypothetical protein